MLTNLSKTYLGLTVIAMGNALPDALTTIALAKQGFAIMGMTGAYYLNFYDRFAGQLFGLLVGLGLALIKLNSSASKRDSLYGDNGDFPLFSQPGVNSVSIIVNLDRNPCHLYHPDNFVYHVRLRSNQEVRLR
jgi:hypothetical protein